MENLVHRIGPKRGSILQNFSPLETFGLFFGVIMPLVSAIVYPTYMHSMQRGWLEWSRLLEAPFVICEIAVILWASRKGKDAAGLWRSLPADVRVASIFLVFGIFASSLFISEYPMKSLTISIITILHLLFALSVFYLLRLSNVLDFRPFVMLLGAGLISLGILTSWKFAFPPPASMVPGGVIEWASALPGFISVRHFGSWTGAITAGFLAMLLYAKDSDRLSWVHSFYFLSAAMTVWSGTRAAILAIALTTLLLIVIRGKFPSFQSIGKISLITGSATFAAWLLLPFNAPEFRLFDQSDINGASQMSGGRLELWAATFEKWQQSAFFGWGSGSQFWEVYVGWPHTQPHNVILQFLISWGIVGALAGLWLLGRAIFTVHIIAKRNEAMQPILAILYALLLMSLVEGMLHYPRFIILIIFSFAAILAYDANRRDHGNKAIVSDN